MQSLRLVLDFKSCAFLFDTHTSFKASVHILRIYERLCIDYCFFFSFFYFLCFFLKTKDILNETLGAKTLVLTKETKVQADCVHWWMCACVCACVYVCEGVGVCVCVCAQRTSRLNETPSRYETQMLSGPVLMKVNVSSYAIWASACVCVCLRV